MIDSPKVADGAGMHTKECGSMEKSFGYNKNLCTMMRLKLCNSSLWMPLCILRVLALRWTDVWYFKCFMLGCQVLELDYLISYFLVLDE